MKDDALDTEQTAAAGEAADTENPPLEGDVAAGDGAAVENPPLD